MKYTDLQNKSVEELNELLKEKKLEVFTLKVTIKNYATYKLPQSLEKLKKMLQELKQQSC